MVRQEGQWEWLVTFHLLSGDTGMKLVSSVAIFFSPQLNISLEISSQMYPEMCFLDDSKYCQADHQNYLHLAGKRLTVSIL